MRLVAVPGCPLTHVPVTLTHLGAAQGVVGGPVPTRCPQQQQQQLPQDMHGGAGAVGCPGPTLPTPDSPSPTPTGPTATAGSRFLLRSRTPGS